VQRPLRPAQVQRKPPAPCRQQKHTDWACAWPYKRSAAVGRAPEIPARDRRPRILDSRPAAATRIAACEVATRTPGQAAAACPPDRRRNRDRETTRATNEPTTATPQCDGRHQARLRTASPTRPEATVPTPQARTHTGPNPGEREQLPDIASRVGEIRAVATPPPPPPPRFDKEQVGCDEQMRRPRHQQGHRRTRRSTNRLRECRAGHRSCRRHRGRQHVSAPDQRGRRPVNHSQQQKRQTIDQPEVVRGAASEPTTATAAGMNSRHTNANPASRCRPARPRMSPR